MNMDEIMAYIGLELDTSIIPLNQLSFSWKKAIFSGHHDFQKVMPRNRFKQIRGVLRFKTDSVSKGQAALRRYVLNTVAKDFSEVAIPVSTSTLDEASCRSSVRKRAVSYLPFKPDKFAIRFYFVVSTEGPYLHSFLVPK